MRDGKHFGVGLISSEPVEAVAGNPAAEEEARILHREVGQLAVIGAEPVSLVQRLTRMIVLRRAHSFWQSDVLRVAEKVLYSGAGDPEGLRGRSPTSTRLHKREVNHLGTEDANRIG